METVVMSSDSRRKKAAAAAEANAMIGAAAKTARPCDGCLRKRARWYCPSDDAFLCHPCDSSVHAANQLARRHDRLPLLHPTPPPSPPPPSWHAGFSRKSRTPRRKKHHELITTTTHHADVVPDILMTINDYVSGEDEETGTVVAAADSPRVPVLDPLAFAEDEEEEYFLSPEMMMMIDPVNMGIELDTRIKFDDDFENFGADDHHRLILSPAEVDLAELVADVESLLDVDENVEQGRLWGIKEEEDENEDAYVKCEKKEEEEGMIDNCSGGGGGKIFLRLNYEDVIEAWGGSPWTTTPSNPPPAGLLLHHPNWPLHHHHHHHTMINCSGGGGDGCCRDHRGGPERVERVLRYKEKRRRRLFDKKIRYQVRKLNAENRPRFKGRFVKKI